MLLPRTLSQHGAGAGSLQVPGLCLRTAPTLSHSHKESSQTPFSQHTPTTFLLSAFGCGAARLGNQLPAAPCQCHPGRSRAMHQSPAGAQPGSVCLSLQAPSCVTHHTGPAPSLSPCAAVVPTPSPGLSTAVTRVPGLQTTPSCRSNGGNAAGEGIWGSFPQGLSAPRQQVAAGQGQSPRTAVSPLLRVHIWPADAGPNAGWSWGQRLSLPPPGKAEPALPAPAGSASCQAGRALENLQGTGRRFLAHLPGIIPTQHPRMGSIVHG